jgi:cellulose synthase/poly-beta-1,6-N-acetylglucosamine synthase-like glycosyltransferase
MVQNSFCAVIPAYNEEKVITASLRSLKMVFQPKDIYVVSDGSKDKTVVLAKGEGVNVLGLRKNGGKSLAQKKVIAKFNLFFKYNYILFSDADSQLDRRFLSKISRFLKEKPALVVGRVEPAGRGLISAFRTYEYSLSHRIYKSAQNCVGVITVAPGCASLYQSSVLSKLNLESPTLTEDFDLTIQIHKRRLGKIVYCSEAVVATQDPKNIKDYWKQILRWNIGTWQNYFLYKLYKINSKYNLELNFLFVDNFIWLVSLVLAWLHPTIFLNLFFGMLLMVGSCAFFVSIIEKKYWIILYIPLFPIFYFINISAYFLSLFLVLFKGGKRELKWNKVARY